MAAQLKGEYVGQRQAGLPHGHGTHFWPDGTKYIGEWKFGMKHGRGSLVFLDGQKYIGNWKNDKKHGNGNIVFRDGEKYIGEWKDDQKHGQGTCTWPDGQKYDGGWIEDKQHGHGTHSWPNGRQYIGEWAHGKEHGHGTLFLPDGEKYLGEWIDGKKHTGEWIEATISIQEPHTWPDGKRYIGQWKDDEFHGQGTLIWPNGQKYVGEWREDKFHGQGTLTWPNGQKYVGEFLNGRKHGRGTFTWPSGQEYVGEFLDDQQHGQGTLTWSNGQKYVGEWQDGKRHGQGACSSPSGPKDVGIWKDNQYIGPGTYTGTDKKDLEDDSVDTVPTEKTKSTSNHISINTRKMSIRNPITTNPFAILKLSADATGQEINAISEQAAMRAKLSGRGNGQRNAKVIERAAEQLRDPIKRFEYSLFWVSLTQQELMAWEQDPILNNIATSWHSGVVDSYLALAESDSLDIQSHNLAVLYLGEAIELDSVLVEENLSVPDDQSQKLWKLALQHWALILDSNSFWARMSTRCKTNSDPRLTQQYLREIRQSLPSRVLDSCREISSSRLFEGDASGTMTYVNLVRNSPFTIEDRDNCLGSIYQPLTNHIEKLTKDLGERLEAVGHEKKDFPSACETLLGSFLERLQPLLDVILAVGDLPGYAEENARDMAGDFLYSFAKKTNQYEMYQEAITLLDLAIKYVSSESLRDKYSQVQPILIANRAGQLADTAGFPEGIHYLKHEISTATDKHRSELNETLDQLSCSYATVLVGNAIELAKQRRWDEAERLLRRAYKYESREREKAAMRNMMHKLSKKSQSRCFVATATFGTPYHNTVIQLREFRDNWLLPTRGGRLFIAIYNLLGPPLAWQVRRHPQLRVIFAPLLSCLASKLPQAPSQDIMSNNTLSDERSHG